jgi:hypothetical protein
MNIGGGSGSAGGEDLMNLRHRNGYVNNNSEYVYKNEQMTDNSSSLKFDANLVSHTSKSIMKSSDKHDQNTNDYNDGLPPWIMADRISTSEWLEINFWKFITIIPVIITFSIYAFLFLYYSYVSICNFIFLFLFFFNKSIC